MKILYTCSVSVQGGKSSYRQGSVLAWNQAWTCIAEDLTICQHRQDKTTTGMYVLNILLLLRIYFYNTLIINSVCYTYLCRCFYRNSAVTCVRTSVLLVIYFNKKSLYGIRGYPQFHSSTVWKWKTAIIRYNIYYNIYYKLIFLIKRSVKKLTVELWNCGTVLCLCMFKMLELSIIHYQVLSLPSAHIPQSILNGLTFASRFRWLFTGKVDDGGGVFQNYFCIFESTRRYFHSLQKNKIYFSCFFSLSW